MYVKVGKYTTKRKEVVRETVDYLLTDQTLHVNICELWLKQRSMFVLSTFIRKQKRWNNGQIIQLKKLEKEHIKAAGRK